MNFTDYQRQMIIDSLSYAVQENEGQCPQEETDAANELIALLS